ncbi:MAG: FkbM family methyltransferase [Alphaproteobacteria bacterium]|nr:FkbM family methyltransferase [Alphaproteobacteria bacterium]
MLSGALVTLKTRGPVTLASAVMNVVRATVQKHILGQRFIEKRIHDYRMLLDLEDKGISRSLLLFGTREIDHKIILEKVLKPGMAVLDIGANLGYYVLMEMSLIGPKGRMIAVEPSPSNIELLKRNLALNGHAHITVVPGAVSDEAGEKEFFLAHQSNLNTFHATGTGAKFLSGKVEVVRTYTVPELARMHGKPDLIRMDVEGHEVEVFNGMIDAVANGELAPMIIFETHLSRYSADHDMEAPLRKLFSLGYHVRYLASSSQRGTTLVDARGYQGITRVRTDDVERVIYENIRDDDAVDFICKIGGARTVLLQKRQ